MVEPDSLILAQLRKIDEKLALVVDDVSDIKVRLTSLEEAQAGVHRRLDRIDVRLHRYRAAA